LRIDSTLASSAPVSSEAQRFGWIHEHCACKGHQLVFTNGTSPPPRSSTSQTTFLDVAARRQRRILSGQEVAGLVRKFGGAGFDGAVGGDGQADNRGCQHNPVDGDGSVFATHEILEKREPDVSFPL
jgi:hypothetical protein